MTLTTMSDAYTEVAAKSLATRLRWPRQLGYRAFRLPTRCNLASSRAFRLSFGAFALVVYSDRARTSCKAFGRDLRKGKPIVLLAVRSCSCELKMDLSMKLSLICAIVFVLNSNFLWFSRRRTFRDILPSDTKLYPKKAPAGRQCGARFHDPRGFASLIDPVRQSMLPWSKIVDFRGLPGLPSVDVPEWKKKYCPATKRRALNCDGPLGGHVQEGLKIYCCDY